MPSVTTTASFPDPSDDPPPPPAPTSTTITGISPGFAWSGDAITLTGTGCSGASVSINNQPATISTLDRSSWITVSTLTVKNTQSWWDLTVNMSVAWLDASGKVIGFTTPHSVTSIAWVYHWPSGDTTTSATFTDVVGPSPAIAPFAKSAQIVLVRDHQAELAGTLSNAVSTGKTIGQVLTTLAPFLA